MRMRHRKSTRVVLVSLLAAYGCVAQEKAPEATPAAAPAPAPPASNGPAITGPLTSPAPATLDAGPFGHIYVNGILNGLSSATSHFAPGDDTTHSALSNGQVWIQKTDGWFQFYLQAGAYNLPSLGTPYL